MSSSRAAQEESLLPIVRTLLAPCIPTPQQWLIIASSTESQEILLKTSADSQARLDYCCRTKLVDTSGILNPAIGTYGHTGINSRWTIIEDRGKPRHKITTITTTTRTKYGTNPTPPLPLYPAILYVGSNNHGIVALHSQNQHHHLLIAFTCANPREKSFYQSAGG